MSLYEIYLPGADGQGTPFDVNLFRAAFDELAEHFGIVETWPVQTQAGSIVEDEYYRYRLEPPDSHENHLWLVQWHQSKEQQFATLLWMIRYRKPDER